MVFRHLHTSDLAFTAAVCAPPTMHGTDLTATRYVAFGEPRRAGLLARGSVAVLALVLVLLALVPGSSGRRLLKPVSWLMGGAAEPELLRACVFLHGAGNPGSSPATASYKEYWGSVHDHTPGCARRYFMHEETLRVGWEDAPLQQAVCALLREAMQPQPQQLVVFAHSMGNLVLAAALDGGLCALPPSAAWYAIAAPWMGSKAADALGTLCAAADSGPLRSLVQRQRFCEGDGGGPSPGYASLVTASSRRERVVARLRARVNGSMCGDSAFGLWSVDSLELQALADLAAFGRPNDGAVAVTGCHPDDIQSAARSPAAAHFTAAVNHLDLTCRHGDGVWGGEDRRPCAWYAARSSSSL